MRQSTIRFITCVSIVTAAVLGQPQIFGQCGVYTRRASTQKFAYPRVYVDRAVDMNVDGKMDLLASQEDVFSGRTRIFVIPNNGNAVFGSPAVLDAPPPNKLDDNYRVGKINNDAHPDIVAFYEYSGSDPQTLVIYLNNGNGTFAAPVISSASQRGTPAVIADLDNDGNADYVGYNGAAFKYSLGNGDGTFDPPVTFASNVGGFSSGDFNNDGRIDLTNGRDLYLNQGNLNFTYVDVSDGAPSASILSSVHDFNGDGKSDFFWVGSSPYGGKFSISISSGTSFTRTDYEVLLNGSQREGSIDVGNFSGNAALDVVVSFRYFNKKSVFVNDGSGNLTRQDYDQRFWRGFNFADNVTADFDNDGKMDLIQAKSATTNSRIMLRDVTSFTFLRNVCDRPGEPSIVDFTGTQNTDWSFWNPATGDWSHRGNVYNWTAPVPSGTVNWGLGSHGDIPAPGDFDGDGITDRAVYRNSTGVWYVRRSSDQAWFVIPFGLTGDKPVVADYDGDTISDIAVWRPSDGNWYIWYMGTQQFGALHFGTNGDKPTPADFDGDLKADFVIFRPSTGEWHVLRSSDFGYYALQWGISTDRPIPADYDGDGKADIAVHRESNLVAYILRSSDLIPAYYQYGLTGDILQVGDYDGDFVADLAVYRPSTNGWWTTARASIGAAAIFGAPGVVPTSSVVKSE